MKTYQIAIEKVAGEPGKPPVFASKGILADAVAVGQDGTLVFQKYLGEPDSDGNVQAQVIATFPPHGYLFMTTDDATPQIHAPPAGMKLR